MTLHTDRAAAVEAARALVDGAKAEGRELTSNEVASIKGRLADVADIDTRIKAAGVKDGMFKELSALPTGAGEWNTSSDGGPRFLSMKSGPLAKGLVSKIHSGTGVKGLLAGGSVGVEVPFISAPIPAGMPAAGLLDLMPARVVGAQWKYLAQTVRTSAAAPVAVGGTKPTSTYSLSEVTGALSVVAHLSEQLDNFMLIDNSALGDFLKNELAFGLVKGIESQVLTGNGTPPNLRGLLNVPGIQTQAFATSATATIRAAVTGLEVAGYDASTAYVVLSPGDWAGIEMSVETGTGSFVLPNLPVDRAARRLFGMPVVVSNALPAKVGFVLAREAAILLTDGVVRSEVNPFSGWATNQSVMRCETRVSLAVPQPLGIVKVGTAA